MIQPNNLKRVRPSTRRDSREGTSPSRSMWTVNVMLPVGVVDWVMRSRLLMTGTESDGGRYRGAPRTDANVVPCRSQRVGYPSHGVGLCAYGQGSDRRLVCLEHPPQ